MPVTYYIVFTHTEKSCPTPVKISEELLPGPHIAWPKPTNWAGQLVKTNGGPVGDGSTLHADVSYLASEGITEGQIVYSDGRIETFAEYLASVNTSTIAHSTNPSA